MEFTSFSNEDFDVFFIDGLEARMEAIKEKIRPKLENLGNHFAPTLTALTGRKCLPIQQNTPDGRKIRPMIRGLHLQLIRGAIKCCPIFKLGYGETHLFIWFAVIYESPKKLEFGKKFEENLDKIYTMNSK